MSESSPGRQRWLIVGVVAVGVVVLATFVTVFLVLTGIIAEPVTVIENILRFLSGQ